MREHGILFSAPMVLALLGGRKTQTRRLVRRPESYTGIRGSAFACPYGTKGDRLWVRETFAFDVSLDLVPPSEVLALSGVQYRADNAGNRRRASFERGRWRPGMYLPRWASRILLEITNVRVQQLLEISELDALAEGVDYGPDFARDNYRRLWGQIHGETGPKSWSDNPWVWTIDFRRMTAAAS